MKKETLAQVFSCEFCEIFRNTYFYRTPLVAAFGCAFFFSEMEVAATFFPDFLIMLCKMHYCDILTA